MHEAAFKICLRGLRLGVRKLCSAGPFAEYADECQGLPILQPSESLLESTALVPQVGRLLEHVTFLCDS